MYELGLLGDDYSPSLGQAIRARVPSFDVHFFHSGPSRSGPVRAVPQEFTRHCRVLFNFIALIRFVFFYFVVPFLLLLIILFRAIAGDGIKPPWSFEFQTHAVYLSMYRWQIIRLPMG